MLPKRLTLLALAAFVMAGCDTTAPKPVQVLTPPEPVAVTPRKIKIGLALGGGLTAGALSL